MYKHIYIYTHVYAIVRQFCNVNYIHFNSSDNFIAQKILQTLVATSIYTVFI